MFLGKDRAWYKVCSELPHVVFMSFVQITGKFCPPSEIF